MHTLSTLLSRSEESLPVGQPAGVESLPWWLRLVMADVVAQVVAGERAALRAARRAVSLETSPEGCALATAQVRDEVRHLTFFLELQSRLGFSRPVNARLGALLRQASEGETLISLHLGTNLVVETVGHALFAAAGDALASLSELAHFSEAQRQTLRQLHQSMVRLQRDESRHLAYGILRLRQERSQCSAARQREFDHEVQQWRGRVKAMFWSLPLLVVLRPWLSFSQRQVLAHFDARAQAIGVQS